MKPEIKRPTLWGGLSFIIFAAFALFILYPVALVLYKSVVDPASGSVTFSHFLRFFTRKFHWSTLTNSLKVTCCATLLSALLGLPLAYLMRCVKIKGAGFLNILIVISYLSPPFIGAYAWIQLLGRSGVITQWLNALFDTRFDGIYGFAGIVFVFSLQSFPLVYI